MNRFAKMTFAAAALSLGVLAAGAASADEIVSLKGKSPQQIKSDLRAAAEVVCKEEGYSKSIFGTFGSCVDAVYEDALQQVPAVALPAL